MFKSRNPNLRSPAEGLYKLTPEEQAQMERQRNSDQRTPEEQALSEQRVKQMQANWEKKVNK